MEFRCESWKMMFIKKYKVNWVFCEENSENIPIMKDDFKKTVKFRSCKTWRSHGKS